MASAFMLIMYGDPNVPSVPLTVDIRTSEGHAPPRPVAEFPRFADVTPHVELVEAKFEAYKGNVRIPGTDEQPTHVGICDAIIRGYEKWAGAKPSNVSTSMDMIWASNWEQDMSNDFSLGRNIDMHGFGSGFGFIYLDMLHAATPDPMFGPIEELGGLRGLTETREPDAPTPEELAAGDAYITQHRSGTATPVQSGNSQTGSDSQPLQQPTNTILGKTLRDWMWHLHGLLMCTAFLGLYPLGSYLIRSGSPRAFNYHWTVQGLATVALGIGSVVGWINSYSISVKHQYIGIAMVLAIVGQIVLGWRHHVQFMATKRKTWLSKSHIVLGRIILPVGYINIVLGMLLRVYGWFTITLVVLVIVAESLFLIFVLSRPPQHKGGATELRESRAPVDDQAEEYFQLDGEDEFSDSEEEHDLKEGKEREKREKSERLARLDKV